MDLWRSDGGLLPPFTSFILISSGSAVEVSTFSK